MAEARAQKRSIQGSPRKMRLMLDLIRGKKASEAISILHFSPNRASLIAEQTLRSAIANFQQQATNVDVEDLFVSECFADGGPMLKRILPAPMGRAYRVRKRSNHLTIVVSDKLPKRMAAKYAMTKAGKKDAASATAMKSVKAAAPVAAAATEEKKATRKPRAKKSDKADNA